MAAECCSVMSRRHLLNLRTLQQCHLPQRHGTQSVTSADLCSVAFVVLVFVFHQCHLAAENSREAPTLAHSHRTLCHRDQRVPLLVNSCRVVCASAQFTLLERNIGLDVS
ncbi:hypothetical protein BD309DRAFT_256485 [Dichomitus squalens]|uniref:Uncharacterized protein n=1 Tax=Dichomitus squalens TaxID=114155 RepID=A0A4Q9MB22_9APHY|nr:hypothetical protein BD311DRAFT_559406 [Dichomitus squalens]TBU41644.1 hypothetical protein BD309DRAFT_256485 [Dichomitus squalens]